MSSRSVRALESDDYSVGESALPICSIGLQLINFDVTALLHLLEGSGLVFAEKRCFILKRIG